MSVGDSLTVRVTTDVPLAPRTTLRLGGAAARMVDLVSEEDVRASVADADARGEPLLVLGGGSNVVVGDAGFAGLVGCMAIRGVQARREGNRFVVDVGAGEDWDTLVARAVERRLAGARADAATGATQARLSCAIQSS